MPALLRLLFLVPLGYVAAVLAAALTITVGAVGGPRPDYPGLFVIAAVVNTLYVGAAAFVPSAVAIVLSEVFAWRSVFFFLAVGGAMGLAVHEIAFYVGRAEVYETRQILFPAGGFVGGFVYWLIAGMRAGSASGAR